MIDLAALAALFFDASKEWTEPKVARFDPLSDAEKEEVVLNLQKRGHELQWVRDTRLRALKRAGWAPVYERTQSAGRPSSQIVCKNLYSSIALHGLVPIDAIRATVSAPTRHGHATDRDLS